MASGDLESLLKVLGDVSAEELSERADAELTERLMLLWRARSILDSAMCSHVAAIHRRGAAAADGAASTQAWLRGRLRMAPGAAANLVRVARQLDALPATAKALAAGDISLPHAGVVAHLADAVGSERLGAGEQILLDQSRVDHPGNVRVAAKHLQILVAGDGADDDERRRYERRYLTVARTFQGMVSIDGLLDPVGGETVLAAISAAAAPPSPEDSRPARQRRADALVDICGRIATCGDLPTAGGSRPQVNVTVELATLRDALGSVGAGAGEAARPDSAAGNAHATGNAHAGNAHATGDPSATGGSEPLRARSKSAVARRRASYLGSGEPVGPGLARMLACDASVIPMVLGGASEPLDVGRQTRSVPVGLRRALNVRDARCRWPGCDRPSCWCDAHHLVAWAAGGPTTLDNLILLCRHHHTLAHHGWRLAGTPNGTVSVTSPAGRRLELTSAPDGGPAP